MAPVQQKISPKDLELVRHFVTSPDDFMRPADAGLLQMGDTRHNPFGDYAPASTQIQGILKGMYDAFTGSLEKANAEEADSQKAYEELMATKKEELATLEAALAKETGDDAAKTKRLADAKQERDDTMAQLKADEKFFEE